MSKKAFLLILFFYSSFLPAQNSEDLLGSWTEIIGNHKISEKWSIPATGILQHYKILDQLEFLLLRAGLTYGLSETVAGTLGYDYIFSEPFSQGGSKLQHRLWEQLLLSNQYSGLAVSHRYRLESTWTTSAPEDDLSHRMRYRLRLQHKLYRNFYATAFNEVFINMGRPYFNHNRLHLGLGYTFHPDLRFEVGYLKLHFSTGHFDRVRLGLIFKTNIFSENRDDTK